METAYDGRQVVGMDLHRRRSVLVRMTEDGRRLGMARITNSPQELRREIACGKLGLTNERGTAGVADGERANLIAGLRPQAEQREAVTGRGRSGGTAPGG